MGYGCHELICCEEMNFSRLEDLSGVCFTVVRLGEPKRLEASRVQTDVGMTWASHQKILLHSWALNENGSNSVDVCGFTT